MRELRAAAQLNYATHSVLQQQEKSLRKGMFPLLCCIKEVCIGLLMQQWLRSECQMNTKLESL